VQQIVFDRRFRGPPESANGGYASGVAAGLLGAPASVRLLRPPPLETPLDVERAGDRLIIVGDAPVIEATPSELEIEIPEPVSVDEARRASERYAGFETHPFASCFVCGPERDEGDGLRIFPGRVDGREMLAATWTPTADLGDDAGRVRPEFVWAALDCPGGWSSIGPLARPSVLGTLAARPLRDVIVGETYVAIGWQTGSEGRKDFVGSALFTAGGELVAEAAATWVVFKNG
jgi:hypothetical protein